MSRPLKADAALCEKFLPAFLSATFNGSARSLAPRVETTNQPLSRPRHPLPLWRGEGQGEGAVSITSRSVETARCLSAFAGVYPSFSPLGPLH